MALVSLCKFVRVTLSVGLISSALEYSFSAIVYFPGEEMPHSWHINHQMTSTGNVLLT